MMACVKREKTIMGQFAVLATNIATRRTLKGRRSRRRSLTRSNTARVCLERVVIVS